MKTSNNGIEILKEFEGFRNKAYLDTGGVITIGYGSIKYPNGQKIKIGDTITQEKALLMLKLDLLKFEQDVNDYVIPNINQNQFDALVCFCYNIGSSGLKKSTLLKKVNTNPNDKSIAKEFEKWKYDNGKIITGLLNRRKKESELYFQKTT